MYIEKSDDGWYSVIGSPIRGFDWKIKKGTGAYYALYAGADEDGMDESLSVEPASPDEQERIRKASLLKIAAWAYKDITETIS